MATVAGSNIAANSEPEEREMNDIEYKENNLKWAKRLNNSEPAQEEVV